MSAPPTGRRAFLARLSASLAVLAGAARPAAASELLDGAAAPGDFDDSWVPRVRAARHRMVFDAPEVNDGLALLQPWIHRAGFRDALGSTGADVAAVVVLRHQAAVLAVDDALWAKYGIGALRKIDDPATKEPATRNPWSRGAPGAAPDARLSALLGGPIDPTVAGVLKLGGIVLTCDLAMRVVAGAIASARQLDAGAVHAELRAGVVPGVIVQPSGVYATARAQEAGCAFMRST